MENKEIEGASGSTRSVLNFLGLGSNDRNDMAKPGDPLKEKSFQFSIRIVNLYKHLLAEYKEYVLSKQVLRSGTSIGANIAEAKQSQSDLDFVSKLSIALKETVESIYWLELLSATNYLTEPQADSLIADCNELKAMLIASVKTKKRMIVSKTTSKSERS